MVATSFATGMNTRQSFGRHTRAADTKMAIGWGEARTRVEIASCAMHVPTAKQWLSS